MATVSQHVKLEVDLDRVHCTLLGMGIAALVVVMTFSASFVSVSLMKKGLPETMNTFSASLGRTFDRLWNTDLSMLVLEPEDLGFMFGERLAILHDAVGDYSADDNVCEIRATGANLDRARVLSIGKDSFTTESFRYEAATETLVLALRGDPSQLGDTLTVTDAAGGKSARSIRWPGGAGGPRPSTPSTGATTRVVAAVTGGPKESPERLQRAEQKAQVQAILDQHGLKLSDSLQRAWREETFESRNEPLVRRLIDHVARLGTAAESTRREALQKLLRAPLVRETWVSLSDAHLAKLFAPSNSLTRIHEILSNERGPLAALANLGTTAVVASTATEGPIEKPPETRPLELKPAEYRQIFRSEEPYRECLGNQSKILRAAEAAIQKGEGAGEMDVWSLARKGHLQVALSCPSQGRYAIDRTAELDVACSVHGSGSRPSEEHRRFAQLFDTYEKARDLIAREGGAAKAIQLLETEHERQPQNPYVNYLLGRAYVENGNYDRAHELLKPLADEAPANVNYAYPAGFAYYAAGNTHQAQVMLERAAKSTFEASREEVGSRAEFYLARDRAAWTLRKAAGRQAEEGPDGEVLEPEERPLRFIDFKQLSEPEYPSQVCLKGILVLEKALGPLTEAFLQPEMKERWTGLYQKYAASRAKADLEELDSLLKSLSKEYLGLLTEEPATCPDRGIWYLEVSGTKATLQCSVHKDIEPEASVPVEQDTPAWQVKALDTLLFYLVRRKNQGLDRCLTNQDRISTKLAAWDDPRVEPGLAELVQSGGLPAKAATCPETGKKYRLGRDKQPRCKAHPSARDIETWLSRWPVAGRGR